MTYIIHTYNLFLKFQMHFIFKFVCTQSDTQRNEVLPALIHFHFESGVKWSARTARTQSSPPHLFFFYIGGIELTSLFKTLKHKSTQHLILQAESNRQKWKDSKVFQDHALLYADECFPFAELMSQPHPSSVSSSSDIVFILLKAYNTL